MKPTLHEIEELARQAGEIVRQGYHQQHKISYKGVIDLVTEVDHASEDFLLGEIRGRWPGGTIMSEESGLTPGESAYVWYVDPLDGTVNYAHQVPIFAVSIACARAGRVDLAVVYDPMRDEMFSAEAGAGAHLNGEVMHVSGATELQKSLLVTGFPYDAWNSDRDNFDNFVRISKMTQGVRRLGSAALDAAWVGAGRFDGFWELSLHAWDIAAGGLIAEESGARVTSVHNTPDYISSPQSVVAATPGIHAQILQQLGQAGPGRGQPEQ
ncbi:MAG TPA: inositol monophosphatase family protein [Anaerolineales bacterium]|nr:inositol monophosphatase family protein [Anaerolineales bacterium]